MGPEFHFALSRGSSGSSKIMADKCAVLAEAALGAAMVIHAALPDRERAFLTAGSRSCWPQVLRDPQADYGETRVRAVPTRAEIDWAERVIAYASARRCAADAIPGEDRVLVATVLRAKLWPGEQGFRWGDAGRVLGLSPRTVRWRFDRAMRRVAGALAALGVDVAGLAPLDDEVTLDAARAVRDDDRAFEQGFAAWIGGAEG